MMKSVIAAITIAAGAMLVPSLAMAACEGGKVVFEDKFEKLNPAWGIFVEPAIDKVGPGGYTADLPPGGYRLGISQLGYFNDYVACATFTVSYLCTKPDQCESQPYVGLVVLANDRKNLYAFDLAPAYATYSIARLQNNKWLTPIGWTTLPDGKKFKSGDKIELQATVKGGNMKFKVDGKDVVEFDGIAPDGGSLVGFEMNSYSGDPKSTQFTLSNFTVKELQ